jgi:hypothetical protein
MVRAITLSALAFVSTTALAQAQGFSDLATELANERWKTMTTQQLAGRMLPPATAAKVLAHEISAPIAVGGPPIGVTFHAKEEPSGDGFCQRKSYYVSVYARRVEPTELDEVRVGPCPASADAGFVRVQPPTRLEQAKAALSWLGQARGAAAGSAAVNLDLSCKSEITPDPCGNARAALAKLPIDNSFIVAAPNGADGLMSFTVRAEGKAGAAGGPVWNIEVRPQTAGPRSVAMALAIPPPF